MNPYHHSLSSVKKFGGTWEDYIGIENWFDETKSHFGDYRHRAIRHHSEGIFLAEKIFGIILKNSDGKIVTVREIGELHVKEDCGFIPSIKDWLQCIKPAPWMRGVGKIETIKGNIYELEK